MIGRRTTLVLCGGAFCLFVIAKTWRRRRLNHIPGPRGLPLVGNVAQMKKGQIRQNLQKWASEYGPVYKIQMLRQQVVVLSGYDYLQEALVRKGFDFAGRPSYFRMDYLLERTGLNNTDPDALWKTLRKLSQRYLKQFGDGMPRLEHIIEEVSQELFVKFAAAENDPVDPKELISEATLKTISVLIVGEVLQPTSQLYQNLRTFEREVFRGVSHVSLDFLLLDVLPFLIHLPLPSSRALKHVTWIKDEIWKDIRKIVANNPDRPCFAKMMLDAVEGDTSISDKEDVRIQENDARMNCLILLNAGHATTTMTFYALLNILAHRDHIQSKILAEVTAVAGSDASITLQHKPQLHFTNATILELFRYFTTLPMGVARRSIEDTEINGLYIPKDTWIFNNLWALHHDKGLWGDPEEFRPERFLNEDGQLVKADHPNRRHLMNFSAGPRVCLGEQLARTRIFIWTANVIKQFQITPAPGNTPDMTNATSFYEELLLRSPPYKVMFKPR